MKTTTRSVILAGKYALSVALGLFTASSQAASVNYGNFGPVAPGVSFLQVTESSITDPLPFYGAPAVSVTGLDFAPLGFAAATSAGGADLSDGQLNFTIVGGGLVGISGINLFESGEYTLTGLGGAGTAAFAGATLRVSVTEINNAAIAPINLLPVNASVSFSLPGNAGTAQPWSLGMFVDVDAQLAALGYAGDLATRLDVVIDNTLVAMSQPGNESYIAKKDFGILIVPEPSSMALAGLALGGFFLARRKRA